MAAPAAGARSGTVRRRMREGALWGSTTGSGTVRRRGRGLRAGSERHTPVPGGHHRVIGLAGENVRSSLCAGAVSLLVRQWYRRLERSTPSGVFRGRRPACVWAAAVPDRGYVVRPPGERAERLNRSRASGRRPLRCRDAGCPGGRSAWLESLFRLCGSAEAAAEDPDARVRVRASVAARAMRRLAAVRHWWWGRGRASPRLEGQSRLQKRGQD